MDWPIEFYILGFVAVWHGGAWLMDLWRNWQWERSRKKREADHVQALAVQLSLAREWERQNSTLMLPGLGGSTSKPSAPSHPGPQSSAD